MRILGALLVVLLLAACGAEAPVIKTQVHLVEGTKFETLLEGTANLDGGRIEQAIKDKPLPVHVQVVVTREGEGEDFAQQTLTFHLQERGDQYVLVHDASTGATDATTADKADGLEPFLNDATEQIATIANAKRRELASPGG